MNALFYVVSILLFWALALAYQLKQQRERFPARRSVSSFFKVLEDFDKACVCQSYSKVRSLKKRKRAPSDGRQGRTASKQIKRIMHSHFPESSLLNLAAVLEGDSFYQRSFEKLVVKLYGSTRPYQQAQLKWLKPEKALLEALRVAAAQDQSGVKNKGRSLDSLVLKDKDLQAFWQRLLKGSLFGDEPYPSLLRYLYFEKKRVYRLNVAHAQRVILESFFGRFLYEQLETRYEEELAREAQRAGYSQEGNWLVLLPDKMAEIYRRELETRGLLWEEFEKRLDFSSTVRGKSRVRIEAQGRFRDRRVLAPRGGTG